MSARLLMHSSVARRPPDLAPAETVECLVWLFERGLLDFRAHRNAWRDGKELLRVPARQVRHRADRALLPKELVREARDVAHVDAGADDDPAAGARPARARPRGHECAARREDASRVEFLGTGPVRRPRPLTTEVECELLGLSVAGP